MMVEWWVAQTAALMVGEWVDSRVELWAGAWAQKKAGSMVLRKVAWWAAHLVVPRVDSLVDG